MIEAFLLTNTDRAFRWLRRCVLGSKCDGPFKYHNAYSGRIEDGPLITSEEGYIGTSPMQWPRDDPRWPKACGCGYEFKPDDYWHLMFEPIHLMPDGREVCFHESQLDGVELAPLGSMRLTKSYTRHVGPDGLMCAMMIPDNKDGSGRCAWVMEMGTGHNDGPWTRTGTPPKVTARPSILINKTDGSGFHGWLTDGVLTPC